MLFEGYALWGATRSTGSLSLEVESTERGIERGIAASCKARNVLQINLKLNCVGCLVGEC
jgi:hypothetical protein